VLIARTHAQTTPLSPPVAFNISHDGPYVLFGVDADEIGVDLMECPQDPLDLQEALSEQVRLGHTVIFSLLPGVRWRCHRIFYVSHIPTIRSGSPQLSPYERNVLNAAVSNSIRSHLLMTLWTVKEAYVKAIGEGIGFGLDRIVVEFELSKLDSQSTPSLPAVHRVTVDGENVAARGWSLAFGTIGRDPISVTNSTRSYAWAAFHRGEKDAPELQHVQWDGFIAAFTQA